MKRMQYGARKAFGLMSILLAWQLMAVALHQWLLVERKPARADAILVLAGADAYIERTRTAGELYRAGVSKSIYLTDDGQRSGWSEAEQRNIPFVELAARELKSHGVPAGAISIVVPASSGTAGEAETMVKVAARLQWRALALVTSDFHTRRALWTFERCFTASKVTTELSIVGSTRSDSRPTTFFWWLSANGWRDIGGEYAKGIYYLFLRDCA